MREHFDLSVIKNDLAELVSYNSVHSKPELAQELAGAQAWVEKKLHDLDYDVQAYPTVDNSAVIIANKIIDPALPTVLLYSHYDVVPVNDPEQWASDPFTLTERNGRWYARGAADCKGNLVMHLAVLRALHNNPEELRPRYNIKVVIEGSEEMGGEGLHQLLTQQPELFRADHIMIADSGNAELGIPTLTTSLRGGAQVRLTLTTLQSPQHSGTFGGPAPDAVAALVRILDSLRDEQGNTIIDGVDCTAPWEGRPYDEASFRADATVLDGVSLLGDPQEIASALWSRPAITINGFSSTPVEKAINAVPAEAHANLNLRVPAGLNAHEVAAALEAHLHAHTPWGARLEVHTSDINEPFAGDIDQRMVECLTEAYEGKECQFIGSGGSIPLCNQLQELFPQATLALYGVEEPTCAIHSVDESVSPEEILRIAEAELLYLTK